MEASTSAHPLSCCTSARERMSSPPLAYGAVTPRRRSHAGARLRNRLSPVVYGTPEAGTRRARVQSRPPHRASRPAPPVRTARMRRLRVPRTYVRHGCGTLWLWHMSARVVTNTAVGATEALGRRAMRCPVEVAVPQQWGVVRLRAPRRAVRRHEFGHHARVVQHAVIFHLADEGRAREERHGAAEPAPDLAETGELELELRLVDARPVRREDEVGAALDHDKPRVGGVLRPRGHVAPGHRLRLSCLPAERRYVPADDDAHCQPRRVESARLLRLLHAHAW